MKPNNTAENVLGTIGTVFWSGQIVPQVWKSWREKSTEGLSSLLMLVWATSAVFLGVYNIVQDINIPLILQPQLFGLLAAISWTQCLFYTNRKTFRFCAFTLLSYVIVFVAFETGMTYAARALKVHNPEAGNGFTKLFGYMSAILVSLGLIPQYLEIYRLKEVIGISLLFMAVDMLGAVFSLLSLIFRNHFDIVASITYLAVIVLDGVIVVCALILNPQAKRRRRTEDLNRVLANIPAMPEESTNEDRAPESCS